MDILNLNEEPGQLPVLAKWHHYEWSYLNPGESIEDRIARMQSNLNNELIPSTFIAKNNELLGSAALVAHDMETRLDLSPWLASVFVAPPYRGQGTGTKLVRHVMQQANLAGIKQLYLFTPDKQYFYQKLGWDVLRKEKYHGHEVSIMSIFFK